MVKRKITWTAEMGDDSQEYSTKKKAVEAEDNYNIDNEIYELENIFRKYFKLNYGDRDEYNRYLYLCVDCGITLLIYDSNWDGHRNGKGDLTYKHDGPILNF